MTLRVSVVNFLNARPLVWGLLRRPPAGVEVSLDLPSACAEKLRSGGADVGLIPSIEYQRIPDLRMVPTLGIAASSEVRSVLLVSRVSRRKIRRVALDPASRTSQALVRILLKRVYGLDPEYREAAEGAAAAGGRIPSDWPEGPDARLVIGDPALKASLNGHVVLDLAAEWRSFSGQSFVFAFWAARAAAASREVGAILRESFEASRREFEPLVADGAAETGLSEAVVEDYLRHSLHYELDRGDLEGLERFYRLAAEEGLIPEARPLTFLPER
jgi:chorismate dehydratase